MQDFFAQDDLGRAPSGKAAGAFRTISEVSTELDVPQHVLRFWETKFPQIKPLKRGGGRRYYRPADIDLLRRIQHLLHRDGYTIKGVQRLLKEHRGALPDQIPAPAPGELDAHGIDDDAQPLRQILDDLIALRALLAPLGPGK